SARIGAGRQAGCAAASSVVTEMGGQLRQCEWSGWDALISVEIVPDGSLSWFGVARARARAGPIATGGRMSTASGRLRRAAETATMSSLAIHNGERSSQPTDRLPSTPFDVVQVVVQ